MLYLHDAYPENLFVTPNIGYIKELHPYLKTVEKSQNDGRVKTAENQSFVART